MSSNLALCVCLLLAAAVPPAGTPVSPAPGADPPSAVFEPPSPPGAAERVGDRASMVERQIARRGVTDAAVLEVMRAVPRHAFVPEGLRDRAYDDTPLPIGHGQTISQPYIVGFMTEQLRLTPTAKVLEIGTGSGYQAAVLAHLTPNVHTIEIIEPLAKRAASALQTQGYETIAFRQADGYHGWPEEAPFDAIIVTCAAGHIPPPLWEQLRPGGRMVIPVGGPYAVQRLLVVEKLEDGTRRSRSVMDVRFVPLTRGDGR